MKFFKNLATKKITKNSSIEPLFKYEDWLALIDFGLLILISAIFHL